MIKSKKTQVGDYIFVFICYISLYLKEINSCLDNAFSYIFLVLETKTGQIFKAGCFYILMYLLYPYSIISWGLSPVMGPVNQAVANKEVIDNERTS